ncbi:MAG: YdcF family protein [Clostridia bacterium]|nr:YdcF family protein [Clostridia bacterium]
MKFFNSVKSALSRFFAPPEEYAKKKSGKSKIFNALCILSGAFFLAMYLPYFAWHAPRGHGADTAASLLVFFCVLMPVLFRHPLKKLLKKAYTPLKSIWCGGMCFYMVSFLIFCVAIHTAQDTAFKESEKQPVVIVFGCQVHMDGRLSAELSERLKTAAAVLEEHPDAICITAGGQGDNEPMPESAKMKEVLVGAGIDGNRIFTEERSTNTAENMAYSIEVLKNKGYDPENCSFIFVSSGFHTPRILLLGHRNGLADCATVSSASPYPFLEFLYTVREYMSYVHLFLFG